MSLSAPQIIPKGASGAEVWPELAHKIEEFGAQTFLLKSTAYVFAKARAPGYRNIMKHVRDGKIRMNVVHWRRISWGGARGWQGWARSAYVSAGTHARLYRYASVSVEKEERRPYLCEALLGKVKGEP